MNGFRWELYNLRRDWTQSNNLAASEPDRLRDMQQRFILEASRYNVFPLDASRLPRFIAEKPSYSPGRTHFTYTGPVSNVPFSETGSAPNLLNRSYTINADIEVPQNADGVVMTDGGRFAGYALYLLRGRPVFAWNLVGVEIVKWQGNEALPPGRHQVEFIWEIEGPGLGRGGVGRLSVDGRVVDTHPMPRSLPIAVAWDEAFNVGQDTGTSANPEDYQVPFSFTGRIHSLTVELGPRNLSIPERQPTEQERRDRQ